MKFTVINDDWSSTVTGFESRAEADNKRKSALSSFNLSPKDVTVVKGHYETYEDYQNRDEDNEQEEPPQEPQATDGGTQEVDAEVIDHSEAKGDPGTPAAAKADPRNQTPVEPKTTNAVEPEQTVQEPESYDLPDKPPVDEDPLTWMPDEFTDRIEQTTVINRKGYEVMAHHYGISTQSECLVGPEETDFEFARVKATATKPDGTEYQAHGSAHTDRGDDSFLLLEMADTRSRKRAIAQATGVGMVAVSELQNSLE